MVSDNRVGTPLHELAAHPNVTARFGASDRLDPYWDGMWSNGTSATWLSNELAQRHIRSGLGVLPAHMLMTPERAAQILRSAKSRGVRLSALGAVDQWRTMSGEQLAAVTGWPQLASTRSNVLLAAFTAGVLDFGEFATPLRRGKALDRARLVRPSKSQAFDETILPTLTQQERVSVTAGYPWDFRRQYDRHNLLSTELGLRVAEFCEVGTVLGEKLSTADLLTWSGLGRTGKCPDHGAADLTVVRSDGLRVAVELTASSGQDFAAKVRRWARLLSSNSLASSGVVILFVEAAPPGTAVHTSSRQHLFAQVTKQIARVVTEFPGTAGDRVAARIGVARWEDWFPASHQATRGFVSMDAVRPTGPPGARWEPVSLLDPFDMVFEPHRPEAMTAVVGNASMLLGVPHWLRRADHAPLLWPRMMEAAGLDELPTSPPSRIGRFTGARSAFAAGIPGLTTAPDRMRVDIRGWPGTGSTTRR